MSVLLFGGCAGSKPQANGVTIAPKETVCPLHFYPLHTDTVPARYAPNISVRELNFLLHLDSVAPRRRTEVLQFVDPAEAIGKDIRLPVEYCSTCRKIAIAELTKHIAVGTNRNDTYYGEAELRRISMLAP